MATFRLVFCSGVAFCACALQPTVGMALQIPSTLHAAQMM